MTALEGARTFLEALVGFTDQPASGPTPSEDRPPRIGTVDATYSGTGPAKVLFDGETIAGTRLYVVMTPVAASDRVVLIPVGTSYVILGKLGVDYGYRLAQTLIFTTGATFSKASYPWLRAIRVRALAGGGGGAGAASTAASQNAIGASGGAGGYSESFITDIAGLSASVAVSVGVAGTAGASGANAGGAGGASSFGALVVANGGAGGAGGSAFASGSIGSAQGAAGGTVTAGDLRVPGQGSEVALYSFAGIVVPSRPGVAPFFGSIAAQSATAAGAAGAAGSGYGSGGQGGHNAQSQPARAGGAGANGIVIVELYA